MSTAQPDSGSSTQSSTDPDTRRQAEQRVHRRTALLLPLILAAVMIFGLLVGFHQHRQAVESPGEFEPASLSERIKPLRDAIGSVTGSVVGPKHLIPDEEADAALRELQQLSIAIEVQSVTNAFDALNDTVSSWNKLKEQVLASDDGRRIASREGDVLQFVAINEFCESQQRSKSLIAESLSVLRSEVESRSNRLNWERSLATTKQLKESIANATSAYERCATKLMELIERSAKGTAAATTLAETIEAREREFAARLTSASVQQEREAELRFQSQMNELRESSDKLARTAAELEHAIAATRSGLMPAATSNSQNFPISRDSYNRDVAEIRSLLSPFISPGYAQPASRDEFEYVSFKSPMSLAAIKMAGGLDDTETGLQTLFRVGGLKSSLQHNDRPLGTFPKMNSVDELEAPDVARRIRRAQRLLTDYGALLVADRLLNP